MFDSNVTVEVLEQFAFYYRENWKDEGFFPQVASGFRSRLPRARSLPLLQHRAEQYFAQREAEEALQTSWRKPQRRRHTEATREYDRRRYQNLMKDETQHELLKAKWRRAKHLKWRKEHPVQKSYVCPACKLEFPTAKGLANHSRRCVPPPSPEEVKEATKGLVVVLGRKEE